ncbi:MAG: glycoside hydrolase family 99-like domain-containing protein [Prolixibacteraceae bacterium]|nr:glycoside hydrolase family 99-like domain-containing protein [Prolixibacteraceae bacterium]
MHPQQYKLIIINAWNEWVEGSYLESDMRWGNGYLEAVRKVMCGKFDPYYLSQ